MNLEDFKKTLEELTKIEIKRPLEDCNGLPILVGSIFDIKQTVNGCSTFILTSTKPLKVHYWPDHKMENNEYEYDVISLLDLDKWETEIEVIDFIF